MKKKLIIFVCVLLTAAFASLFNYAYAGLDAACNFDVTDGGAGSSFVNSCPGAQGQRQHQAVQCDRSGYHVKPGCAAGAGLCDDMNPCNGARFKVGYKWCYPEVK